MNAFLKQVAKHYYLEGQPDKTCFIFPNRRSIAFFKKYLGEEIAASGRPCIAPRMLPINDFFYRAADATSTDRVVLLIELYSCYRSLNPEAESLDDFIYWGDVLLSDFNDVDKYMVDAGALFTNVSQFKDMTRPEEYMTEKQKEALSHFISGFKGSEGKYRERFRRLWNLLGPLYRDFNRALDAKGLSYEGKVYRSLAERLSSESAADVFGAVFPDTRRFVFVGLNALNKCEKTVMRRLRDARLAEFCWDYSSQMIKDRDNKSSFFMSDNIVEFPQAFEPDSDCPLPATCSFHALSVPSSVGQAKQLPRILSEFRSLSGQEPGVETAIILPDEALLIPVLNSIPGEITDLNVTMGYPLNGSELWSLMNDVAAMQMHLRSKEGQWLFYHKYVWSIFNNSIVKSVLDDAGKELVSTIKNRANYYISGDEFSDNWLLSLVFRPAVTDLAAQDEAQCHSLAAYLRAVVAALASRIGKDDSDGMAIEKDFAMEYYQTVGRLDSYNLALKPQTYLHLLSQLLSGASVPFNGEPLKGLQIMGPLETRALDFKNLVILSFNEGVFPRHNVASSFIPAELRKGFDLPTYEYQDAVWAYYFYRLIQRAENVWMVYDSRTEVSRTGEESRYLKQLELHFGVDVKHKVMRAPVAEAVLEGDIPKTAEDIEVLRSHPLSASALQNWLTCQAKFYFYSIKRLKEKSEVNESLDAGAVGNVFHKTMQELYTTNPPLIEKAYLKSLLGAKAKIREVVRKYICEELHTFEVVGRNLLYEDMVCRHVEKVITRDIELMGRYGVPRFSILGLEKKVRAHIDGFPFIGFIDRLDSFSDSEIRIVDYKTGSVSDNDFIINEDNAADVVAKLFGPDNSHRPKIALQLYIYDTLLKMDRETSPLVSGRSIVNSIYQPYRLYVNEVENVSLSSEFCSLMKEKLSEMLERIADLSEPFHRSDDQASCQYCDFKQICGR